MDTSELIEKLAANNELTKAAAKAIVHDVFKIITDTAVTGDEVNLRGFGKFKVQSRPARSGRNPQTGAIVEIAASKKLAFQPAKAVKVRLNA